MRINLSLKHFFLITILLGLAFSLCTSGKKDDGTGNCVPTADPCATDFKDDGTGTCISVGDACASSYHDDGSGEKCIAAGGECAAEFRDDGTGLICIASDENCATNYKDDGSGVCIPENQACGEGNKDAGNGTCIFSTLPCATDYHDDGTGINCISGNGTCSDNYIDDGTGEKCVLNCTQQEKNDGLGMCINITDPCALGYTSDTEGSTDNCNACDLFFKNDGTGQCVIEFEDCAKGFKDNGEFLCVLLGDACATGYKSDETSENCFACDTGYKSDGDIGCILPNGTCALGYKDDGAGVCVDIFQICADGFKDDGSGLCVSSSSACGANFQDDGNGNCIIVIEEDIIIFILIDPFGRKAKCDPLCSNCKLGGQCTVCKIGTALKAATKHCVVCEGCLTCTDAAPTECTSCFPPQVLNKTAKKCVDVVCTIENCLQCNLDSTCKTCFSGYQLINSTCTQCTVENCKSCTTSIDSCDTCLDGNIYHSKKNKCLPCATGCKQCKKTDISACIGCNSGYYAATVDGKDGCARCFDNCDECSSATKCTRCTTGYIASEDGSQCQIKCSDSCATCDDNNPDLCLTCYSGADLNTTTNKCITDLTCNNNDSCSACSEGYAISSSHCYECTYTANNCIACTFESLAICARCPTGYYLSNGTCNTCTGNCLSCMGKKACVKCAAGYYLVKEDSSPTGSCKVCDSTCLTCSGNPTVCTSCAGAYKLSGSSCISPNRVTVIITLGIAMESFLDYYDSLILWFIARVTSFRRSTSTFIFKRRHIILYRIKSGSININSDLLMDDAGDTNSVASGLTNAMNSGSESIDGLVISGSAVGTTDSTTTTNPTSSSSNLGLILGIVIPLGILILIAIIVIIVKVYDRKNPNIGGEDVKEYSQDHNSGKHFYSEDKFSEKV